jgi:hypothetical protein
MDNTSSKTVMAVLESCTGMETDTCRLFLDGDEEDDPELPPSTLVPKEVLRNSHELHSFKN